MTLLRGPDWLTYTLPLPGIDAFNSLGIQLQSTVFTLDSCLLVTTATKFTKGPDLVTSVRIAECLYADSNADAINWICWAAVNGGYICLG